MSAPTEELGQLSIKGTMPTTRSQSQREVSNVPYTVEEPESDSDEETSSDEDEEGDQTTDNIMVAGHFGLQYDLGRLPENCQPQAIQGLQGEFAVDQCKPNRETGYQFQVVDRGDVCVGEGAMPLKCSCERFLQTNSACRHIYWLVDQLYGRVTKQHRIGPKVTLSARGEARELPSLLDMLRDDADKVFSQSGWLYVSARSSASNSDAESTPAMSRSDKARDLLSTFSETIMPEEFRPDLFEAISKTLTPEQCVIQRDLEGTIFRLAVHDDNVYSSLRKVMPAGARAAIFFEKILRRINQLLEDFRKYSRTGARRRSDSKILEIPAVCREVREYLSMIRKNITIRSPHGSYAAQALVGILRAVSNYNLDAFENIQWNRQAVAGETPQDRNLYVQLIYFPVKADECFVLDCLELLPNDILSQYCPQLQGVLADLKGHGAPMDYLRRIQALIAIGDATIPSRVGIGSSAGGPSGYKRPATTPNLSGRKRTK
ncbi:hypothetical protein FQN57_004637 [Myotisia sp. PD_48]|nr:hypothetical protein FQN57_004637 [Myotisia sp. PD_48]